MTFLADTPSHNHSPTEKPLASRHHRQALWPRPASGILFLAESASSKRNSLDALCPTVCIQTSNGSYYLATPRHGFGPARLRRFLHSHIGLIFSFRLWRRRRQRCGCSLSCLIFCACTGRCYRLDSSSSAARSGASCRASVRRHGRCGRPSCFLHSLRSCQHARVSS